MEGKGVKTFFNGDIYDGEWYKGKLLILVRINFYFIFFYIK